MKNTLTIISLLILLMGPSMRPVVKREEYYVDIMVVHGTPNTFPLLPVPLSRTVVRVEEGIKI